MNSCFILNTLCCELLPLCRWEPFQFECAQINIIAESCVGSLGDMVNVSVPACSKNKPFKWSISWDCDMNRVG